MDSLHCSHLYMLLFQPAVEFVRMKVPEMMTPACVTVQMATVETTVKVSTCEERKVTWMQNAKGGRQTYNGYCS